MTTPVIFSTGSLYPFGVERVFSWISDAGYDGAEVMMDDRWDTHQADYLRDLSGRHGIRILALHPPIYEGAWRLPPGETLIRSARMAKSLDIPTVVAHPPRPGKIREWREGPLRQARDEGVVVAVENMPKSGSRGFLGLGGEGSSYSPEHLDGLGDITLDTSHVAASRLDLMGVYSVLAGCLRHVHLSDSDLSDSDLSGGDQHRLPGKGRLPLRPFLAALARDGYPGAVSLELKPFQSGAPHPEKIFGAHARRFGFLTRRAGINSREREGRSHTTQ